MSTLERLAQDEIEQISADPLTLELRDDRHRIIPALPTQAFVTVARKLRDEGRLELVLEHATAEQITGVFDLDVWEHERVLIPRARDWLFQLAQIHEQARGDRGNLAELMYEMDPEMWTLGLCHGTAVGELDPEDDDRRQAVFDSMASLLTYETPDGFFVVGVPDHDLGRQAIGIIDAIYRDNLAEGRKLLMSIKWSLASELEENLLRWRAGRLADLGFPAWEDAMQLFRPLAAAAVLDADSSDPDLRSVGEEVLGGADTPVTWTEGGDLLRRVMARLDDAQHGERVREFMLLVNELMAAQRFEPGDETLQARAIGQAQATLNLAFEILGSQSGAPDVEAWLAARVEDSGLRRLFRVGYGPLAKLRQAALTLHKNGRVSLAEPGSLLDRPFGPALRAFATWYPELPLRTPSVASSGAKGAKGAKALARTRPIHSAVDVAQATNLIAQAAGLARLTFDQGGFAVDPSWVTRADEPEKLVLGDLVRTALVCQFLPDGRPHAHAESVLATGGSHGFRPLGPDDLRWAAEHMLRDGRPTAEVVEAVATRLGALGRPGNAGEVGEVGQPAAEAVCDNLLTRFVVELASLENDAEGRPDLTRVGGFLTIQSVSMWLKLKEG